MKKMVESILIYFTFGTSLVVLVGNIYMFSYYNSFRINIYEYLSLAEIPSFFLPILLRILSALLLLSLLIYSLFHSSYAAYERRRTKIKGHFGKVKATFIYYQSLVTNIVSFIVVGAFFLNFITKMIDRWDFDIMENISGYLLVGCLILMWFTYFRRNAKLLFNRFFQISVGFVLVCYVITQIAKTDAYFTKHISLDFRELSKTYIFSKEDGNKYDTVKTNKYLIYIGRTNSNIFFFEKDSLIQTTLIFKRDKLISPEKNSIKLSPIPTGYSHW